MVEVRVRDEDPIDLTGLHRGRATKMPDASAQDRVRDEARAVHVNHDGAVPQPGEPAQATSSRIEYPVPAAFITPFG
jgi:hypothetical protein